LHVLTIRLDWWEIRGQFGNASDVLTFAFRPEQARAFPQTFIEVNLCPYGRCAPRIQKEILDDARGPFDLRFNRLQSASDLRRQ
jgi:hypothetical protein